MSHQGQYDKLPYSYIDTAEDLETLCQSLASVTHMAVDTEFLRENTYYPELCLIQIKSGDILACIDPIAINKNNDGKKDSLSAFSALLANPAITKVLHSASQDMEIFFMLEKTPPRPIFDTQVAAPLLGFNEQIGYGNLVKEVLSINLPKAHTRADWSRRPIPENQIHYALDDVIHLEAVYFELKKRLEKKSRLDWLAQDFEDISNPERYNKPAKNMWQKIRAAQFLKGAQLATLQALAEWRELTARESNRPRNWILKDDAIADLAKQRPTSSKELSHIRSVGAKTVDRHGKQLLQIIQDGAEREPVPLPDYVKKEKLSSSAQAGVDVLAALVAIKADEHKINATLLAPRKMLEACWRAGDASPLGGWRHTLLGADIQNCLAGRVTIGVENSQAVLIE